MGIPFFIGKVRTKDSNVLTSDNLPDGGGSNLFLLAEEVRNETR